MSSIINQSPYLRTSREFPEEMHQLCVEVDKAYVDIANNLNNRTIGLFPTNRPAITGESWFFQDNKKQQTLRQLYRFTAAGSIPTGLTTMPKISRAFGSYTDGANNGTNQYGVIFGTNQLIAGQVSFYVTLVGSSVNIVVQADPGAPPINNGIIVLEWLSS